MKRASIGRDRSVRLDEFDETYDWASLSELAEEFWRYARLADSVEDDSGSAAWTCVNDLVAEPAWDGVLTLLDELLSVARDDAEVAYLAAGPLEDLVRPPQQGPLFIDAIEARAHRDPMWLSAVRGVWLSRKADRNVNHRLTALGARHSDGQEPS